MKITKSKLKQLIKEELKSVLDEAKPPAWRANPGRSGIPTSFSFEPESALSAEPTTASPDEPDVISRVAAGDIDMLQAFEEMIELKGGSKDELHATLERLLGLVEDDPDITQEEETGEEPFRGPDPETHRRLRRGTREQGGYNRRGWKPRE